MVFTSQPLKLQFLINSSIRLTPLISFKVTTTPKRIPTPSLGSSLLFVLNFSSELIPVASETYTVDEEHVLPSPKLDGYIFSGWSDDNGNVIKNIPAGTVGAKTYTANWISERNQAWTYKDYGTPLMYEDSDTNTILFVYNIGEIRNVPLSVVHDFGKINSNGVTKTHTETFKKSISQDCMDKYTNTVKKATTDSYSWTLAKEWSDSTTVNESWAKENSVTQEQINSYYKNQSNNWYVSSGSSGSDSITQSDSSSSSAMLSSVRNKKTDDKHSTSTETNVSANLDIKNTTTIGAKVPVDFLSISAENKTEIGLGLSASRTDKESTSSRVQTDNTDSASYNSSKSSSTTKNSTASWNNESGYGGSSEVGQSSTASKAISEKISQEYNIGKSYINTDSQSSTQGTQASEIYAARLHFQTIIVKQKFLYPNHNIPFIISSGFNTFFHHNNFFERVISFFERTGFLLPFFFIGNIVCRLNIVTLTALVRHKINLNLFAYIFAAFCFFSEFNNAYINTVTPVSEFVINDILHQMSFFYLPKIKPCVTKSGVLKIQLIRRADIFLTFYIIPFCFAEQEGVF